MKMTNNIITNLIITEICRLVVVMVESRKNKNWRQKCTKSYSDQISPLSAIFVTRLQLTVLFNLYLKIYVKKGQTKNTTVHIEVKADICTFI